MWLVNTSCPPSGAPVHGARYSMADVPRLRPRAAKYDEHFHDSYAVGLYDSPQQVINNTFERGGTLMVGEGGVGWLRDRLM